MQMLLLIGCCAQWCRDGRWVSKLSGMVHRDQVSCWCAPCVVIYTCGKWLVNSVELLNCKIHFNTQNSGLCKGRELEGIVASGGLVWAFSSPGWSWCWRSLVGTWGQESELSPNDKGSYTVCLLFVESFKYHLLLGCCAVNWCYLMEWFN